MVNAGLEGFVKAIALELENNKRVLIVHTTLVRETAAVMGMDSAPWPSANIVAKTYISILKNQPNGNLIFVEGYNPN